MTRLAVIPSDPLKAYSHKSDRYLQSYFNPLQMFDEIFVFSPLEDIEHSQAGMEIIPTSVKGLKQRLIDYDIDIVRAYGGYWACDMACNNKIKGVPVVVSIHDTKSELLYNSIKKADVVFCVSEAVKKLVSKKFKKLGRAWLLPNRVDFNVMRPLHEDEFVDLNDSYPFKFKVLQVGRKTEQKNLDTLIKALRTLGNEYCIIAIGRGDTYKYVELAKEQGVIERCYFIDSINNEELPLYYSLADCMCVPSRWEGFGIVFIEALACGSIVVTSDIAPMNEYIKHGENGLLVREYENPKALAEAIKIACNDRALKEKIKKHARNSIKMFEKNRIEKLESHYYEKVLSLDVKTNNLRDKVWNFLR